MKAHVEAANVENGKRKIVLDQLSGDELEELVEYFYTGKCPRNEVAAALLKAADMYALRNLKEICEVILIQMLHLENALQMLVLGHLSNASRLKHSVYRLLTPHSDEVLKWAAFKDLMGTNTELCLKAIRYFSAAARNFDPLDFCHHCNITISVVIIITCKDQTGKLPNLSDRHVMCVDSL